MQTVIYRFTEADLTDARRFSYHSLPFVRVVRLAPIVIVLGNIGLGAWLAYQGDWYGVMEHVGWLLFGLLLLVWMFVADLWLLPRSVRKSLARDKGLQGDNTVTWDAERLTLRGSHGQSLWPWGDFVRWQESPGGLLLWQSDRLYNFLPKRCLSEAQAAEIRDHLRTALGPAGRKRR
ncbi:MAG TPA: YcxB family protein [Caulobacter sp.]|nr:YcxB family protein [Caulobacter sp.]